MSASTPGADAHAALAAADRPLLETRNRSLLLLGVMLMSICQFLDATIANVALPHMKAALGASTDSVSWVLTSFMIATAVGTPLTGWLSDRIGSRRLFIWSSVGFLVTSGMCGAATSLEQMVLFRALQGLTSAFIGPMTMTIMFDISAPSKQPMTIAMFSLIVMVAPISGPALGGVLVEYLNWRWIYYVNLPIGIPALAIIWWLLPSRPLERRPLDLFGFAAIAVCLCALQLALDRGQHEDWLNSPEIVFELLVAVSALWVFIVHSRHVDHPLFPRGLFRNANFMIGLGFMTIMGLSVVGLSSVLPMMFQSIYGYPVVVAGMLMAPRGLGVMMTSVFSGALARHFDPRALIASGYLLAAGGMWYMTGWTIDMGMEPILLASFIQGMGFGFIVSNMNLLAFATLPPQLRPDGSGLMSLFRSLGGSVGISIVVTMLARNQQVSHADLGTHVTADLIPGIDLPATVDRMQGAGAGIMAMINGEVTRQAMMIAFLDDFYLLFWMLLVFAPLPLFLRRPPKGAAAPPPMAE